MELTEEKALGLTRELWLWLAENPDSYKEDWPRFSEISGMTNSCPLCEWYFSGNGGCPKCPLTGGGKLLSCYSHPSFYNDWNAGENRSQNALAIVACCDESLERVRKEQSAFLQSGQVTDSFTVHSPVIASEAKNLEPITKVNMTEAIETILKKLDLLNADLATFRLKYGMGDKLVGIYRKMGDISSSLYPTRKHIKGLEKLLEELNGG